MYVYTGFLISVGLASGVRAGTQKLGNFCLLLLLLGKSSYCITEDKSSFDATTFHYQCNDNTQLLYTVPLSLSFTVGLEMTLPSTKYESIMT